MAAQNRLDGHPAQPAIKLLIAGGNDDFLHLFNPVGFSLLKPFFELPIRSVLLGVGRQLFNVVTDSQCQDPGMTLTRCQLQCGKTESAHCLVACSGSPFEPHRLLVFDNA